MFDLNKGGLQPKHQAWRQHCGAQRDSAAWHRVRSTAQHAAGAFGHRRGSKQKPIEGLGLTRAETWCQQLVRNYQGLLGVSGPEPTPLDTVLACCGHLTRSPITRLIRSTLVPTAVRCVGVAKEAYHR